MAATIDKEPGRIRAGHPTILGRPPQETGPSQRIPGGDCRWYRRGNMNAPPKRSSQDSVSCKRWDEYRRSCSQDTGKWSKRWRNYASGEWEFRSDGPKRERYPRQKRRHLPWRFWRPQTCSVSARRLRYGERRKDSWSCMASKVEFDGTNNPWGHTRHNGWSSSTWAGRGKRADRSTAGPSAAWKSWRRAPRCWWHRPPSRNCDGIVSEDLGQPSCGPVAAVGAAAVGGWLEDAC